ncbi:ATP-binding cassette domain-containing protein [Tissierella carlieri]|uniref:ABC transporter ATP-binding protein n=1 Tax=Tissierella TaxID=41273 RepID=UPI000BA07C90|nr:MULTISPECIES: oligopeptide/dipeptide ABC transporter ATP-binding protein [Tissierella]MBU5314071.1 ATP-binding cassette domain-containing protein [Tissierella carlieri]OZV11490.1 peptide ABC transporter ATP-binding protein [Tissierella sp. P1]
MENRKKERLIEVNNLKKYFPVKKSSFMGKSQYLKAVDDVSFYINEGETLGLVGESGCGKSTTGRSIIRLFDITGGQILYRGKDIAKLKESDLRPYRRKMQVIFQDPYASLNPTLTVKDLISEPLDVYHIGSKKERQERTLELLEKVGLGKNHLDRYPHEFSGGQRQRIGIARALSINPEFILCDEPISALDVSIQAQVVNMLEDLQNEMGLTYLFIAHDLSMVRHISHRIGVMYLGKLIEIGKSDEIYNNPLHPYTQALLSSVLEPDPRMAIENPIKVLEGDVPSPLNPPSGCKFVTRCKYAMNQCHEIEPKLIERESGHMVACHLS